MESTRDLAGDDRPLVQSHDPQRHASESDRQRPQLHAALDFQRGDQTRRGPAKNQADCGRRAAGSEGRRGPKILRIYRRPEGRRHQDSGGGGLSSRQRIGQARRPDRVYRKPWRCSLIIALQYARFIEERRLYASFQGSCHPVDFAVWNEDSESGEEWIPAPVPAPEPKQEPETIYIDLKQYIQGQWPSTCSLSLKGVLQEKAKHHKTRLERLHGGHHVWHRHVQRLNKEIAQGTFEVRSHIPGYGVSKEAVETIAREAEEWLAQLLNLSGLAKTHRKGRSLIQSDFKAGMRMLGLDDLRQFQKFFTSGSEPPQDSSLASPRYSPQASPE
ncbi:hypothetical protein HNY73_007331 [Argiope bruennichi]|uniref:Histone H2A/H2B/H3 domain-containing protein n=1 Tax=Argiope bruennichi TaxID=94029 RepID=A0A8T0FEK4_ARGBR|nr:hypothetical protein HNY73_007331 [Argiope bruennichi]